MKVAGLLAILAGLVIAWGIGYKGLDGQQLQADIQAWLGGQPTVTQKGAYA